MFSFPLDFNSDLDQWEDMNDIDNCPSDTDENLIEVASDLVSDEDENSDNYSSCQSDDADVDKATSDEFESDSDGDIISHHLILMIINQLLLIVMNFFQQYLN